MTPKMYKQFVSMTLLKKTKKKQKNKTKKVQLHPADNPHNTVTPGKFMWCSTVTCDFWGTQ